MSDKEVKKEKVVTKYDLKMQRRQAEKEKEIKRRKISKAIGIVVAAALVVLVVSFPVRSYLATHSTFVTINGENITKVEFDYNYNNVVNNYVNQYGTYLSYFGLDVSQDLSTQAYSDDLSWKDYFEEMTVDSMKSSKALKAEADAAGFEYDATEDIESFKDTAKEAASSAGVSTNKYVKQVYGQYASVSRLKSFVAESARINAYYEQVSEGLAATDEEIQAYYEENSADYDSVDYYVSTFPADITSEEPTDEETAAAMEEASELAEAAVETLTQDGDVETNVKQDDAPYVISDWLFDDERQEGDTTVIEDSSNNQYYALSFIQRYLDETPTADVRVIMTQEMDGQDILDEWEAGEATEDSFAEICNKYSADGGEVNDGGLMENITKDSVYSDVADWIFEDGRQAGDTSYVTTEEGYTYVMYYVSQGDPEWKTDIAEILLEQAQSDYVDSISADVTVEDKKGHLNYLKVRAAEEASEAEEAEDGEDADNTSDVSANDVSANDVSANDVSANDVSINDVESAEVGESSETVESSEAQ
jgi:hypothetical protein